MTEKKDSFNLSLIPPEGDEAVGPFVHSLFEEARKERERLKLPDRWRNGYALRVGKHFSSSDTSNNRAKPKMVFNMVFAFIERTVANLTSRTPIAEAKTIGESRSVRTEIDDNGVVQFYREGENPDKPVEPVDPAERIMLLNQVIKQWWTETEQTRLLGHSATSMETYGAVIEKYGFDHIRREPLTLVLDIFSFLPAPGNWRNLNNAPYMFHAYPMELSKARAMFNRDDIVADNNIDIMGKDRDEYRTQARPAGEVSMARNFSGSYGASNNKGKSTSSPDEEYCLIQECWIRDNENEWSREEEYEDPETGEVTKTSTKEKYPGGIRVIQICNAGEIVLSDMPNPNVNPNIPDEYLVNTYGYDHFPFSIAESYHDTGSIWGLSAPEQIGDIQLRINEMMTRMIHWLNMQMFPILIVPKDAQIPRRHINNRAGSILEPISTYNSQGLRFLQPAMLTPTFFQAFGQLKEMMGMIWAIEDIDRGAAPGNIVAASAIASLQERNAVLMRHKVKEMDYLVRQRGRFAISMYQNFGVMPEAVDFDGDVKEFRGIEFVGSKFNYFVESGSAYTRTASQETEMAMQLWSSGIIQDPGIIIDMLDISNKKEIKERLGENQLDLAMNILVQAGYAPDGLMPDGLQLPPLDQLKEILQAPQYAPREGGGGGGKMMSGPGGPTAAPTPHAPLAQQGSEEQTSPEFINRVGE